MDAALTLNLSTGQVLQVSLSEPAHLRLLTAVAVEKAQAQAAAEVATRTYHMGTKPTPGLGYDDRLTTRIKCCATSCYTYLDLPVQRGGLRHQRIGKKYLITEQAVREWLGDAEAEKQAA
jgi:hypothetical protein